MNRPQIELYKFRFYSLVNWAYEASGANIFLNFFVLCSHLAESVDNETRNDRLQHKVDEDNEDPVVHRPHDQSQNVAVSGRHSLPAGVRCYVLLTYHMSRHKEVEQKLLPANSPSHSGGFVNPKSRCNLKHEIISLHAWRPSKPYWLGINKTFATAKRYKNIAAKSSVYKIFVEFLVIASTKKLIKAICGTASSKTRAYQKGFLNSASTLKPVMQIGHHALSSITKVLRIVSMPDAIPLINVDFFRYGKSMGWSSSASGL